MRLQSLLLLAVSCLLAFVAAEAIARCCLTVRNVGPPFTRYDAVDGLALRKSFSCQRITPEFTMSFSTNSHGFRGPEPTSRTALSGCVLFLGDSFTMGYGVNDGEEFPALVRERLATRQGGTPAIPVVNAGIGGTGNGRWIRFLRREAPRLAPRLVVLQMCENDFADNLREGLYELSENGELSVRPVAPKSWPRRLAEAIETVPLLSYSYVVGLGRQALAGAGTASVPGDGLEEHSPGDQLTLALVDRALAVCEEREWPVMVIGVEMTGKRGLEVRRLCERRSVSYLPIPDHLARPDLHYSIDAHWNRRGHRFVADLLIQHQAFEDLFE